MLYSRNIYFLLAILRSLRSMARTICVLLKNRTGTGKKVLAQQWPPPPSPLAGSHLRAPLTIHGKFEENESIVKSKQSSYIPCSIDTVKTIPYTIYGLGTYTTIIIIVTYTYDFYVQ